MLQCSDRQCSSLKLATTIIMKWSSNFYLIAFTTTLNLVAVSGAWGQIVPDNSLRQERSRVTKNNSTSEIRGGARRGNNLFHSFKEFSITEGQTGYFIPQGNIGNIFTRVTGRNISQIQGILKVRGNANLFLLNPNGIIFGPQAQLQLQGSFIATTANSFIFPDGQEFSATNPQAAPLLTVNVVAPIGIKFGNNPGVIVNQSQVTDTEENPIGLTIEPQQTLALIGGAIELNQGVISAISGNIEIGSVGANSLVSVNLTQPEGAISYQGVNSFQDITLSQAAAIYNNEEGGRINLQGQNITLTGDSLIAHNNSGEQTAGTIAIKASNIIQLAGDQTYIGSTTIGTGTGSQLKIETGKLLISEGAFIQNDTEGPGTSGDIEILAQESVELKGTNSGLSEETFFPSAIANEVIKEDEGQGEGQGGNLTIETHKLAIRDGAQVYTSTKGSGNAGDVKIRATDTIEIVGFTQRRKLNTLNSVLLSQTEGEGNSGKITVETNRLIARDGGQISSTNLGQGKGGDIEIKASSIELTGAISGVQNKQTIEISTGVVTNVEYQALGDAGSIYINAETLTVVGGAQIASAARSTGQGGDVTINASESIFLSGFSPRATLAQAQSGIFTSADVAIIDVTENPVVTRGDSGIINITTPMLTIENGAKISSNNYGLGKGGNMNLNVDRLIVTQGGSVTAGSLVEDNAPTRKRGPAGNVDINATESVYLTGVGDVNGQFVTSSLFTAAQSNGDAGRLNVVTNNLTVENGAEINASTTGSGNAGNIEIKASEFILNNARVTADVANSGREGQGNINIEAGNISLNNQAAISTNTVRTQGGNITLQADNLLLLRRQSNIAANATSNADGGNININAKFLITFPQENSNITANAQQGDGGQVAINAQQIFGFQTPNQLTNFSDITASSDFGLSGLVTVNTFNAQPNLNLPNLSEAIQQPNFARLCETSTKDNLLVFVNIGRGGSLPEPVNILNNDNIILSWLNPTIEPNNTSQQLLKKTWLSGEKTLTFSLALPCS